MDRRCTVADVKSVFGVISLVIGLISLAMFAVRVTYGLAAVFRRFRELMVDAFSQPPSARNPTVPRPVDIDLGSLLGGGYWADRERS